MKAVLGGGLAIGLLCGAWMFVMGITRWYRDPNLLNLFFLVIVIQLTVLVMLLRGTAREGRRYAGQVATGTLASLVGGVLLFGCSLVFTTVAFPEYFGDLLAMQERLMREAGRGESEIAATLEAARQTYTPLQQALGGLIGTAVTGFVASIVIGVFVRSRA